MKKNLGKIEKKLQSFFEDRLKHLNESDPLNAATQKLLEAQITNITDRYHKQYSPNIFKVVFKNEGSVNIDELETWIEFVKDLIKETAQKKHLYLSGHVQIEYTYNSEILDDIGIEVAFSDISTTDTVDIIVNESSLNSSAQKPKGYLITPLETIFQLSKKIINIGRDESNDLVIDNLRISRTHAQIREINGTHVLFDLNSTVGTKVNKQSVSQHTLSSGDVIEIADVSFIYNADLDNSSHSDKQSFTKALPIDEREK